MVFIFSTEVIIIYVFEMLIFDCGQFNTSNELFVERTIKDSMVAQRI